MPHVQALARRAHRGGGRRIAGVAPGMTAGSQSRPPSILLPDGRRVAYQRFGDELGYPILALHGTPGSRLKFAMADRPARTADLSLWSVDRWGYGGTDAHPRPSLSAFAADMAAFADAAGLARFGVLGVSGGGPFAAAVASELGDRVTALALVAPVGPIAGTPAGGALSPFHILAFRGLSRSPSAVRAVFLGFRALLRRNGVLAMRIATSRAALVDRRTACQPYERQSLIDAFREGLSPGAEGPVADMQLFGRQWDLDLERITAPSRLWIGDADRHVPQAAARGLAMGIAGCQLVALEGAGHYWVMRNMPEVLGWLADAARAQQS